MTSYSMNEIFTSVARLGVILSLGSMLITGFLHGDMMAFAGAGIQYWIMQPVFWNILQVGWGGGPGWGGWTSGSVAEPLSRGGACRGACAPAARHSASPAQPSLRPLILIPSPPPQVNAFCNTDDITWGTKNLDTKKDATEAKTLLKSGLAYSANQVGVGGQRAGGVRVLAKRHRHPATPRGHSAAGYTRCAPTHCCHAAARRCCRPRRASLSGRR